MPRIWKRGVRVECGPADLAAQLRVFAKDAHVMTGIFSDTRGHYGERFEEAANEIERLAAEAERLHGLLRAFLDNDPDDMAADGVTLLNVWRKEAREVLKDYPRYSASSTYIR